MVLLSSKRRNGRRVPYVPKAEVRAYDPGNRSVAEFQMDINRLDGLFGGGGIGGVSGGWWGPYRGLMSIPSVNRCVKLIAGTLANSPVAQFRQVAGGTAPSVQVYPTPGFLADPAAGMDTYATVMSSWAVDFLLGGDAIGIMAGELADGTPSAWFPVSASMVQVAYVNGSVGTTFTNVYDSVNNGEPDQIIYRVGSLIIPADRVLHVKNINAPGSLRGSGVFETNIRTLELAYELDNAAKQVSRNGVPTGLLQASSPDTTFAQLSAAKQAWIKAQSIGTVAALAPGVTFTPLSWNPEERQLLEARKFSDVQISQLFGVPLGFLAQGIGGLTYASPTLDSKSFLQWCMNDVFNRFEQALSAHLPRGNTVRFDRDSVIVQDPNEQMLWLMQGIGQGIILKSEARTFLGLPPIGGIDDEPLIPSPGIPQTVVAPVLDGNSGEVVTDNQTEDLPSASDTGGAGNGTFNQAPQANASGAVK